MTGRLGPVGDVARCWAAFALLGAGIIHLAVTREHLVEWWVFGGFFAVVGAAQVLWSVALLVRDRPPLVLPTVMANGALVVLWVVTRSTGLPVGPTPGRAEPVGVADLACAGLELALIALLLTASRSLRVARKDALRPALIQGVPHAAPSAGVVRLTALALGAVLMAAATTPALAATAAGRHAHMTM